MKLQHLVLVLAALTLSACGGMKSLTAMAGVPQTKEVELSVASICTACAPATHKAVNPFTEPVKYTTVSVAEVDEFVISANKLYGSVMVAQKLQQIAKEAGETGKVEGFKDTNEVVTISGSLIGTASKDIPKLLSTGAGLATSAPKKFVGVNAVNLPTAVEQIDLSIERLNAAKDTLGKISGMSDEPAKAPAAPASEAPASK